MNPLEWAHAPYGVYAVLLWNLCSEFVLSYELAQVYTNQILIIGKHILYLHFRSIFN